MSGDAERGAIIKVYKFFSNNPHGCLIQVGFFWMFLFIFGVVILTRSKLPIGVDIMLGFGFIVGVILHAWLNTRIRLVIRENGIEYHGYLNVILGKSKPPLFSPWTNLRDITVVVKSDGEGNSYEYHLNCEYGHSMNIGRIIPMSRRRYSRGSWFKKRHYDTIDVPKLVQSTFGQDLQKYAPHVIEKAAREQKWLETEYQNLR